MDCKIQIADSAKKELAEIVKYISVDLGNKKAASESDFETVALFWRPRIA